MRPKYIVLANFNLVIPSHLLQGFPEEKETRSANPQDLRQGHHKPGIDDDPCFVRKRCAGRLGHRNFTSVFGDRTSFRAKGLRRTTWNRNFTSAFGDRNSFRAKGLRRTTWNRNFTSAFGDRTSFRAKGLRFVPSRWHCPCPRLQERKERRRGQEG